MLMFSTTKILVLTRWEYDNKYAYNIYFLEITLEAQHSLSSLSISVHLVQISIWVGLRFPAGNNQVYISFNVLDIRQDSLDETMAYQPTYDSKTKSHKLMPRSGIWTYKFEESKTALSSGRSVRSAL